MIWSRVEVLWSEYNADCFLADFRLSSSTSPALMNAKSIINISERNVNELSHVGLLEVKKQVGG